MALIRNFFALFGRLIAAHPFCIGLISLTLGLALSGGMIRLRLKDHIRDGYTPENAPSRTETAAMRRFWNASGDPMKALVMIRSKIPDGNMLRLELLSEVVELHQFLMRDFTCSIEGNRTFTYEELCPPFCEFNFGLELFVDALREAMASAEENDGIGQQHQNNFQNLSFPLAIVHSFKLNMEWFFFGVTLRNDTTLPEEARLEQKLTNIEHIQMLVLAFHAERSSPHRAKQLSIWEMAVFDYLQNHYHSDSLDVQIIGVEILDNEMTRDHRENIRFFALGFLAMSIFVGLNVFGTAQLLGHLDPGKAVIAAATVLCPFLAIGATYGALSWVGLRTNSFLLILPYLILGIGVDDGFLLMHRWFQLANDVRAPRHRLVLVLSEIGPSITVTTLTNIISFGVGAFTPTPEIRLFCFGTALALALDYALQLCLFCPLMLFSARFERFEQQNKEEELKKPRKLAISIENNGWAMCEPEKGKRKYSPLEAQQREKLGHGRLKNALRALMDIYCKLLSNKCFACVALLLLTVYWIVAIIGSERIQTRLDIDKILPRDSKMRETSQLLDQHIWANHLPMTVLVDGPLNVSSGQQMAQFWAMVDEFESLPHSKGAQSSLIWLREYEQFFLGQDDSSERLDQLMRELDMEEMDAMRAAMRRAEAREKVARGERIGQKQMDLCRLHEFLDLPFYLKWSAFVRLHQQTDQSECPTVSKFIISFAFRDILGWDQRIELVQRARSIAAKNSLALGLAVSVWEENNMFVDQMLSLHSVAIQSGLLTLVCMAIVCAVFVPNPVSVLLASGSICSISMGVFGFLSWLGFDLDPITMAATLMSIGLSVDFTAHVVYHFRQDFRHEYQRDDSPQGFSERQLPLTTRADKLRHTLESVGWPMLQSGISTALCTAPLLFIRKYAPTVFANAVFLVCGWGLLHGLVLLPSLLCLLPRWCSSGIRWDFFRSLFGLSRGDFCVRDGGERKHSMEPVRQFG